MEQFKVGQVVKHRGTGDRLVILTVKESIDVQGKATGMMYFVRTPSYQRVEIHGFEIEQAE